MKIGSIMFPSPESIDPDMTIADACCKMAGLDVDAIPVSADGDFRGLLTFHDIIVRGIARGLDPSTTRVREVMSDEADFAYDDDKVEAVVEVMRTHQIRSLPVLNRDQQLIGMLALPPQERDDAPVRHGLTSRNSAPLRFVGREPEVPEPSRYGFSGILAAEFTD